MVGISIMMFRQNVDWHGQRFTPIAVLIAVIVIQARKYIDLHKMKSEN